MGAKPRVLIDANVILDVLQSREPFYDISARVLDSADTGSIEALVAAHSITTIFYLLAKGSSRDRARVLLTDLLQSVAVASVDQSTIEQALNLPYRDFEDAVQMMAAVRSGAQYVVTRNPQDYRAGPLPVLQPVELLAILGS